MKISALLLAAGMGTRLRPLTDHWPKCLMPIGGRPLLEYWLETLKIVGICKILVNLHHHADSIKLFLSRPRFEGWVDHIFEPKLLGTAGTLVTNKDYFNGSTTLLIHADNWCRCSFEKFIDYHRSFRPNHCPITMMTFDSLTPDTCGIVEKDEQGVVQRLHEKVTNPPGNCANGAVYLLEPEVLEWICEHPGINDFSRDVLPHFMGRIATWHNSGVHRDIGQLSMLRLAQLDPTPTPIWREDDAWQEEFIKHPVHKLI